MNNENRSDSFGRIANILRFPTRTNSAAPELNEILKDEEVADFYKYVQTNNLRAEALELLERRLGEIE